MINSQNNSRFLSQSQESMSKSDVDQRYLYLSKLNSRICSNYSALYKNNQVEQIAKAANQAAQQAQNVVKEAHEVVDKFESASARAELMKRKIFPFTEQILKQIEEDNNKVGGRVISITLFATLCDCIVRNCAYYQKDTKSAKTQIQNLFENISQFQEDVISEHGNILPSSCTGTRNNPVNFQQRELKTGETQIGSFKNQGDRLRTRTRRLENGVQKLTSYDPFGMAGVCMHAAGGMRYECEYVANERCGVGEARFLNDMNDRYVGEWRHGKEHGLGVKTTEQGEFWGQFQDGRYCGKGVLKIKQGDAFLGDWQWSEKQQKYTGFGVILYGNGDRYEGQWRGFERFGRGRMIMKNGEIIERSIVGE